MKSFQLYGRWGLVILLACGLFLQRGIPVAAQTGADPFVVGQIVVKLNPLSGATIEQINTTYGTTVIRPLVGTTDIYLLQVPAGADVQSLAETMAADLRLLYAEPNLFSQIIEGGGRTRWARAGSDPTIMGGQYAAALLNLPAAHQLSTGAGTVVAVLDTGFQLDHPQLAGNFTTARYDFVDNDTLPTENFTLLDPDGDGFVNEFAGHGTHVAGIVHLVAPNAQIMPLRVMNSDGIGNAFIVAEAMQYAAAQGAAVINLSLGTPEKSELLKDVVEQIFGESQIVIVAAAGNENTRNRQWPAASSYAVAVTSVGPTKQKSAFANYGSWVDIAAPGEEIPSTFPINRFASWSGTSFATPFIAGQFALLRSTNAQIDNNQLRQVVRDTAQPLSGRLGAGLPDFVASLRAVQSNPVSLTASSVNSAIEISEEDEIIAAEDSLTVAPQIFLPQVAR